MIAGVVKEEKELDSVENQNNDITFDNSTNGNKGGLLSIADRRAATCGFNDSSINSTTLFRTSFAPASASSPIKSPYFTVPPGISPSVLLDSPVMLPNDQAQLSPTTGAFASDGLKLRQKLGAYRNHSPFTVESSAKHHAQGLVVSEDVKGGNENHVRLFEDFKCPLDLQEIAKNNSFVDSLSISESLGDKSWLEAESSAFLPTNSVIATSQMLVSHNEGKERIKNQNREKQQKGSSSVPKEVAKYSEDGFYWRKYGQKQVKSSEYPRSYFKCTNTNCLVKKKVERSHDGQITEIVYKGSHNHPKPQPLKSIDEASDINEGVSVKVEGEGTWRTDGLDSTFRETLVSDFSDPMSKSIDCVDAQELPSTFSSQDGEEKEEGSRDSISFNDDDDETGECEPKRRKRENFQNETSTMSRSNREPRVVVQIESEIDILDDGYRWRKYGQKVVKGNPNPRSYYKCTTPGCPVRKHVERAANDIKSVITTYEGKHNHEVPSSKNGSVAVSDIANLPSTVANNTSLSTSTAQRNDHLVKTGNQSQELPLYMSRKPLLNYDFIRSTLPGNFPTGHDLNFRSYPISLPPLPPIPYSYNSILLNGNQMNNFPGSNIYHPLPDYMSMHSTMNHVPGSSNVPHVTNGYPAAHQASIRGQECQPKIAKPKQEQRDDGALYDANSLSILNHGNGPI